jgi:hypothetical protein
MNRRRRTFVALITSAAAATTFGISRLIYRQQNESNLNENNSNELSLKTLESKLNLTNDLLKNKGENPYISIESTDAIITARYHLALHYINQTRSTNTHIRERGLSHLAKLNNLPPNYYSILGQQLDYHSTIKLARTYEANSNYFPTGPPYIFSIGNQKILATDNVENVNDDDILLHTLKEFLEKLNDKKNRPLDILSHYYLKLVRNVELKIQ